MTEKSGQDLKKYVLPTEKKAWYPFANERM